MIYIVCPNCEKDFKSRGIQVSDRRSFESNHFSQNSEPCPHCRKMVTYDKSDMRFRDEK